MRAVVYDGFEAQPEIQTGADPVPEHVARAPERHMLGDLSACGLYARHVDGLVLRNLRVVPQRGGHTGYPPLRRCPEPDRTR